MTNSTVDLIREPLGAEGKLIYVTVGSTAIKEGIMVAQLDADGTLVPGSTALSGDCIGVSTHAAAASGECAVETDRQFLFANGAGGDACSAATPIGWTVYMADDHTVADNSDGGTRKKAGIFMGMQDSRVKVWVTPASVRAATEAVDVDLDDASNLFDTDNVEAALTQIVTDLAAVTATHGANMVGFQDGGSKTTAATVDDALDELYVNATTAQAQVNIPLTSFVDADGDPLAKFSNGDSTVPGFNIADSEAFGIRWNNHATPDPILTQVSMPQDLDDTKAVVVHVLASKTGNTVGDAVTFDVTAFFHTVAALHDADENAGGTSGAMTGDAAAKTVQEVTLSIAHGNVPASPSSMSMTLQPTDGTLGTDDVIVLGVWLEYTRKVLAA